MTVTIEQDTEAVRLANIEFYQAVTSLDIEAMDRIWTHEDGARCIHPGWEVIEGWETIRQSWSVIFKNATRLVVEPSEVTIRLQGEMAWVCCLETIVTGDEDEGASLARATNLFVRTPAGWKMILHHASQVPAEARGGADDDDEDEPTVH
ncbi:MAG TPA: nuclear transport factor 2 family protein [Candidatus Polarisedimenticolia bacterium]|nr:nuclear transport factor 2 family protein [Candidatus Polarisedimenticolia bacterium]